MLEVIAKREIAEHFKVSAVSRRDANAFDVGCTDTLLTCGHAPFRRGKLAGKILFKRRHSRIDEKKALVTLRDKGKAFVPEVILRFKK